MTGQETAQLLALVQARYPHRNAGEPLATVRAWHMTLGDVPYWAAEAVLAEWFRTERWAPDPAELRTQILALVAEVPSPADAWLDVLRHMRAHGQVSGVRYEGPAAIRQAVESIGGWRRLRMSETPEADRKAFLSAYETYARRAAAAADVAALIAERTPALGAKASA